MEALYREQEIVEEYISEHEALLAPARRILPEILSEIFLWCFSDGMLESAADIPIMLGQVCSYWRSVTILTPDLWSSLSLQFRWNNFKFNSKLKLDFVTTALSRSGARPLTINLLFNCINDYWDEHTDSCLDAILNHSRRWKSMNFELPWRALQKLSVVKHATPLLETLGLRATHHNVPFDMTIDAFELAPRLRSLCTDIIPNVLQVPWENLECFTGVGHSQKDSLDWLHRCPNLVECVVIFDCEGWDTGLSSSFMAHFPRLTKLDVSTDDDDLGVLFKSIVTPLLRDLRIEYKDLGLWVQSPFTSFLHRSACALRKLHICEVPLTDLELVECLRMAPSLMELIVDAFEEVIPVAVTDRLIQQLTYEPSKVKSLPLVPQLQAITLKGCFRVGGAIFRRMVASRWRIPVDQTPGVARLETVNLKMLGDIGPVTRARLEIYKHEGLGLDINELD